MITWLRLLHFMLKINVLCLFFKQWVAKIKPIAPCMCNFPHTLRKLDVIASNSDCFIVLFASVVICWSNYKHLKTALLILSDKF